MAIHQATATLHKIAVLVTETAILHTIPVVPIHLNNHRLDFLSHSSSLVDTFLILIPWVHHLQLIKALSHHLLIMAILHLQAAVTHLNSTKEAILQADIHLISKFVIQHCMLLDIKNLFINDTREIGLKVAVCIVGFSLCGCLHVIKRSVILQRVKFEIIMLTDGSTAYGLHGVVLMVLFRRCGSVRCFIRAPSCHR